MKLFGGTVAGSGEGNAFALSAPLPLHTQWLLGMCIAVFLLLSFLLAHSILPIAILLGVTACWMMLRTPLASILGFMGINVLITLMPREQGLGGAPTSIDLALGGILALIIGYWFVKIRIIEQQPLSSSVAQLSLMLFFAWSAIVTAIGILTTDNPPAVAIREILNLLPLLILPVLYERYIIPGSKEENWIFGSVLFSGVVIAFWNILTVRNNLVEAYYVYQMGKGYFDVMLAPFVVVLLISYFMVENRTWILYCAIGILFVELLAILISLSRNTYVATPVAGSLVWLLGRKHERKLGAKRILFIGLFASFALFIAATFSRLIALLLENTVLRFLSTRRLGNDLSLRERFSEWSGEWHAISHSPILGHGFGSSFRFFSVIHGIHLHQSFSHNSYLYLIFKTGFIGILFFLVPYVIAIFKAFKLSRSVVLSPRTRLVARGCFGCLIILLFAADLGPIFDSKTDLMWVALIWGYLLALEKQLMSFESIPQSIG